MSVCPSTFSLFCVFILHFFGSFFQSLFHYCSKLDYKANNLCIGMLSDGQTNGMMERTHVCGEGGKVVLFGLVSF